MKPNKITALRYGVAIYFFISYSHVFCQPTSGLGSDCQALAGVRFGTNNAWSAHNSITDMHTDTVLQIGISIAQPYLVSGLYHMSSAAVYTKNRTALGGYIQYIGYSITHQLDKGVGISRILNHRVALGVGFKHSAFRVNNETQIGQNTISIHLKQEVNPMLTLYYLIDKTLPHKSTLSDNTAYYAGLAYTANPHLKWVGQAVVGPNVGQTLQTGFRYRPIPNLILLCGVRTAPTTMSFGFALHFANVSMGTAFSHHNILGFTPTIAGEWRKN